MDWRELSAALVAALAWPFVASLALFLFKRELASLIRKVSGWEGLGQRVTFGEQVREAETEAQGLTASSGGGAEPQNALELNREPDESFQGLLRDAESNPSYVILESWERLQAALLRLLVSRSEPSESSSFASVDALIRSAEKSGTLSAAQYRTVQRLRSMRNSVAHGMSRPTAGEAITYAELAHRVATEMLHQFRELDGRPMWEPRRPLIDSQSDLPNSPL